MDPYEATTPSAHGPTSERAEPAYSWYKPIAETRQLINQVSDGLNQTMIGAVQEKLDEISFLHHELALDEDAEQRIHANVEELKKQVALLQDQKRELEAELAARDGMKTLIEDSRAKLLADISSEFQKSKEEFQCMCKESRATAEAARRELASFKVRYGMITKGAAKKEVGDNKFTPPSCLFTTAQVRQIKAWIADTECTTDAVK